MPQSGLWRKMKQFGGSERPAEIRDGFARAEFPFDREWAVLSLL
jgi:hypothetical protein